MNKDWFKEYCEKNIDEQEVLFEYCLDDECKILLIEYSRFKNVIELLSKDIDSLQNEFANSINVADEIALLFDDECKFLAGILLKNNIINKEVYYEVMQIDKLLSEMSDEHNINNWTVEAMNNDMRWTLSKKIANDIICGLPDCKTF